jgi:hypothetical protein
MSDEIFEVATHSVDVAALGQDYSDRVDGERILLALPSEIAVADEVRFVVLLLDGTPAFAGAGRCVQVSDQGPEAGMARFETLLDSLAFDERSAPVYEYIVAVRQLAYQSSGYTEEDAYAQPAQEAQDAGHEPAYEAEAVAEAEVDVAVANSSAPPSEAVYAAASAHPAEAEPDLAGSDEEPAYSVSHGSEGEAYTEDTAVEATVHYADSAQHADASEEADRPTAIEVSPSSLPTPIPAAPELAAAHAAEEVQEVIYEAPAALASQDAHVEEHDEVALSEPQRLANRADSVSAVAAATPARDERAARVARDVQVQRNEGLELTEPARARPEPRVYTTVAPEPLPTGMLSRPALTAHWAPAAPRPPQRSLRPTAFQAHQGPLGVPEVPPRPELDRSHWVERAPAPPA